MATTSPSTATPSTARPEMAAFNARLPELLALHPGQFAAVVGSEVLGAWPTWDEAIDAAVEKAGVGPFMVRQVIPDRDRPIGRFSRDLV